MALEGQGMIGAFTMHCLELTSWAEPSTGRAYMFVPGVGCKYSHGLSDKLK